MRFESFRAKGLGVFRDEVAIDFEALPGKLVALQGANGSGKSTMLELLLGSTTRECPTRGSLIDLARDRDAFLEVKVTNGATHTLRHTLDAISKKSEALVLDAAGAPELTTTSVRAFDDWAKSHLPAPEVLLSSVFSAQQHGGFCEMSARGRKEVLSRVLGIEQLEGMAERARRRANEGREALAGVAGELRALPELDAAALDASLHVARAEAQAADKALADARVELEAGTVYRAKAAAIIADRTALTDIETRIANNRTCLREAPQIRAAVARAAEIDTEVAELRRESETGATRTRELDARGREARERAQRCRDAIRGASAKVDAARSKLALRPEIDEAHDRLPLAQRRVEDIESRANETSQELTSIQASMLGVADARITGLRKSLVAISAKLGQNLPDAAHEIVGSAIADDDARSEAARTAPARMTEAKARLADVQRELPAARVEVGRLERLVARAGELDAADRELAEATSAIEVAKADEEMWSADALRFADQVEALRVAESSRVDRLRALMTEREGLAPLLRKAAPLADAEAKLAGYEPRAEELRARITEGQDALALLPEPKPVFLGLLEGNVARAHMAVGKLEGQVAQALVAAHQRKALDARRAELELDVADWALLAEDLGSSGLPALLIDAAGPELTALVNDLLHTCVGTRFTVAIETTRPSADGKKQIETCDVRVLDTEEGRDAEVATFSGGQRAILGEAVSLALTMLACRRSGLEGVTLIRDETAAALDETNGRAYVAMLRKAADIVGASHVLFVAHDNRLQELADVRICISNGQVSIQ